MEYKIYRSIAYGLENLNTSRNCKIYEMIFYEDLKAPRKPYYGQFADSTTAEYNLIDTAKCTPFSVRRLNQYLERAIGERAV
jgi:hypothetical protein